MSSNIVFLDEGDTFIRSGDPITDGFELFNSQSYCSSGYFTVGC